MTETLTVQPQNLDYYNYFVMCNYVFNEQKPVIENAYTYEENGVLYCASATQKGVYCYTYCLNNPLKYRDPSGNRFVDTWYTDVRDDFFIQNFLLSQSVFNSIKMHTGFYLSSHTDLQHTRVGAAHREADGGRACGISMSLEFLVLYYK